MSIMVKVKFSEKFKGGGILKAKGFWTKDGAEIKDSEFESPEGANDWTEYPIAIQFTNDGKPIGPVFLPPVGANDVHIELFEALK